VIVAGELVIALAPGELARLEGFVHRRGAPLVDADVRLLAHPAWIDLGGDERTIGAARTDERGRFELAGPHGSAQVVVRVGETVVVRTVVELPSAVPLRIDLGNLATLTIRVERSDGAPAAQHVVGREGADGRRTESTTDEQGLARLTDLPAGEYRVWAPAKVVVRLAGLSDADVTADVELLPGEEREVRLALPPVAAVGEER